MQFINWVIQILLFFCGALLGNYLGLDTWYIALTIVIIAAEGITISLLLNLNGELKKELESHKDTISKELLNRKSQGQNTADITIFPKSELVFDTGRSCELSVIINTPTVMGEDFDLQLLSDKEVKILVAGNNTITPKFHSGRFMYLISGNFSTKKSSKYQKYELNILSITNNQSTNIEILAQNQELSGMKSFIIQSH
ncbi:hypothetical protein HYI36_00685 [Bacillus sp. Gen3]|uniref:hypothetical protein n=1 Tax=Heyndrickxia oleronia TaxID=38875 RepID=UPI0015D32B45|nr:hypothetical protein [Bacillus sp. Gen3]